MSAYVIGQLHINNPQEYQEYLNGFLPCFERHGGQLLATSKQETEVLEGDWALPRTVLMRFPNTEAARAWYTDPEYQELAKIRHRTADANLVLVEGIA
jgi:uncharacterized protein (DUF1330 family)